MLNLDPETVQLLAALVILPPLAYLARWLRRYRQRPRITDRGYYVGRDQYREERKAQLRLLQSHPRVLQADFTQPAAKGGEWRTKARA